MTGENQDRLPAELGTLDTEVGRDVAILRDFAQSREKLLSRLFGRTVRRSATRDELLRVIVLAFARGELLRASRYVEICAHYATGPSIRAELDLMQEVGLIAFRRDLSHPRASLVVPTRKLIAFYNEQMPRLRDEVVKLMGELGI